MRIPLATTRRAAATALAAALLGPLGACSNSDDPTGPAAPGAAAPAVSATGTTSVTLSWAAVPNAASYAVERAAGAGAFAEVAAGVTATTYTDAGLAVGATYRYRVTAANSAGARGAPSAEVTATTGARGAAQAVLTGDITAARTLYADTTYVLRGYVKVRNGAVLTVQPGTTVVGDTTAPGSSLWITRGAQINASGRADAPIVFTSQRAAGSRRPGDWGGIVLIGNGVINRAGATITTEGGTAGVAENYAGGTNNNDNSGTLRYVRIEFAGFDVSNGGGQELNSLSMYAVGRGTTLEYVQSLAGLDDAFEWWGGAVDGRYLVSYESGDDHFDWTEGYVGRNQFLIALQTLRSVPAPGAGVFSSDPRGFEGDGCDPAVSGCVVTAAETSAPYSMPVFANFSMVGTGVLSGFPADGNGATIRRGSGGTFRNGVLARWRGIGLNVRDAFTEVLRQRDSLSVRGLVLAENGFNFDTAGAGFAQAEKFANSNVRTGASAAALFTNLAPASLDWRPAAGGLLATGGEAAPAGRVSGYFSAAGGWANTTYVGAVDPAATAPWYAGWTRYATN